MENSTKESFEQAIKEISSLHGNMSVLAKLDSLLRDYNSSLDDIETLVQSDGAISATMVKIANSAIYGFGDKCESIADALRKVGYDQALKLVSLALSKQVFMRDLEAYGISADDYWSYSFFSAVFMEEQGRSSGLDSSRAYLMGLLHSIGRVVINELLHDLEIEIYWDRFIEPRVWEKATIGFGSDVAGSVLLKNWEFPPQFCWFIAKQSDPEVLKAEPLMLLLDFSRQVGIHLEDENKLASLCAPSGHPFARDRQLSQEALLRSIRTARLAVKEIGSNLKSC